MKLWLPIFIASKQQQSDVLLIMTLQQSAFWLKALGMHPLKHPKYMRRTPNSGWGHQTCWEAQHSTQLIATLTPSTVSMMSSDDRCFVCGWTGHFDYHCPVAQCYGCDYFGHFAQDCPHNIPRSGTPCHHQRSWSRHQYTPTQRDRSHSYYSPRHRRHDSRSVPPPVTLWQKQQL